MKNLFHKQILLLAMMLISFNSFACDCECEGDCTFRSVSSAMEFVALVKVIEYSDFLDYEIDGYDKKMPFSMIVEIIKKYKGSESRKQIKIWGDNGVLCRPYIANFEIGNYYLIAPNRLNENSEIGKVNDYDLFSCWTDYLRVDNKNSLIIGEYSKHKNKISIQEFESEIRKIHFKRTNWFANNENQNFYKSDSISLFRILNLNTENEKLNETYIKLQYIGDKDMTQLNFKRNGKLEVEDLNVENWTNSKLVGKWKWEFDSNTQIINLFFKRKLHSSFKIVSRERDNTVWKFEHRKKQTESKIDLLILELVRIKK